MDKEISDALHFLLHCSLKDVEFETQREQFEFIYKYIENLEKETEKLHSYKTLYQSLKRQKEELRSWLEEEKERLTRECSQIYEDSLGKTRLVNEDIFNEVDIILSKLEELEGVNDENNT